MAKNEFVDGLEVGVFTHLQFRVLTKEELREAVDLSKKIDSCIAEALGAHPDRIP
jgi:hypothetical protein